VSNGEISRIRFEESDLSKQFLAADVVLAASLDYAPGINDARNFVVSLGAFDPRPSCWPALDAIRPNI
jgi:hypothetical protein